MPLQRHSEGSLGQSSAFLDLCALWAKGREAHEEADSRWRWVLEYPMEGTAAAAAEATGRDSGGSSAMLLCGVGILGALASLRLTSSSCGVSRMSGASKSEE